MSNQPLTQEDKSPQETNNNELLRSRSWRYGMMKDIADNVLALER